MKTYVIMLAKTFPRGHSRFGDSTKFKKFLLRVLENYDEDEIGKWDCWPLFIHDGKKIHTIRDNYDMWKKRFDEIDAGKACLSIREWEGKPYRSKQVEIIRLTKEDGIGLQKLTFNERMQSCVEGKTIREGHIAYNDGLQWDDWEDWFKNCDMSKPLAIIHFTKFRY